MNNIKGRFRTNIFEGNNGYIVGLFKVKEADSELEDLINKTITFSGYFASINTEEDYMLIGEYINHPKYGYQFQVSSYERIEPEEEDAIIEFLTSSLIKGCGLKTAKKIVSLYGKDSINKIKESMNNLLLVPGIKESSAKKIYDSVIKYSETDKLLIDLKKEGFSIKESLKLIKNYGSLIYKIIEEDIYSLIDDIEFNKLDKIYLHNHEFNDVLRVKACIIESLKRLSFTYGDTFSYQEEIYLILKKEFNIYLEETEFLSILKSIDQDKMIIEKDKYYLTDYYEMEIYIAETLTDIKNQTKSKIVNFDKLLNNVEKEVKVKYNNEQRLAIKEAIENNVSIITGGPGTGKTTIINGLVKMFRTIYDWYNEEDFEKIVLVAPTGRASKKMAEATKSESSTIHRYLKWNKEDDTFAFNEYNKRNPKVIIIDETSMVDTYLLNHLLKGVTHNTQIIFVGDENQLPSVGPGNVLGDLIASNEFVTVNLKEIYRQSNNSYIPYLAQEVKDGTIGKTFFEKKDDFKYIETRSSQIKEVIRQICDISNNKSLTEDDIQVLAPMYKGENGIDNLNILLQEHFNPQSKEKAEIKYGDVIYRENDKVIQLVNDSDNNVYNGDIGLIGSVNPNDNKNILEVDFDGNIVNYKKEDIVNIKHAYAISIHKSQGSEFNHVILPITMNYSRMLYNKLIYTGITRAKRSLIVVGDYKALERSVMSTVAENRKTTLKERLNNVNLNK